MIMVLFYCHKVERYVPCCCSFKLKKKCNIADKKENESKKLIAEINMKYNSNGMINLRLGVNNGQNTIDQLMTRITEYLEGHL